MLAKTLTSVAAITLLATLGAPADAGWRLNGTSLNGTELNGFGDRNSVALNGITRNGISRNGITRNGITRNGVGAECQAHNDRAGAVAAGGEACRAQVISIELPNGTILSAQ
jgi:hypothetical protein